MQLWQRSWRSMSSAPSRVMLGLVSALLLTQAACTRDAGTRRPHSPDRPTEASAPAPVTPQARAAVVPASRDQQSLAREFEQFFEPSRFEQRASRPDQAFRDEVSQWLVRGAELLTTTERRSVLRAFTRVALLGCDADLRGCRVANRFRRTPGAVELFLAAADDVIPDGEASAESILNRHRLLSLAFAAAGEAHDPRIGEAWIRTAKAYEDVLQAELTRAERERQSEAAGSIRRRLGESQEIVDLALSRLNLNSADQQALLDRLVQDYGAWNFDAPRDPRLSARREALLRAVAPRLLNSEFIRQDLQRVRERRDSVGPQLAELFRLRPWAQETLGLQRELPQDFNTWLFESLWMDRLTPAEAVQLREVNLQSLTRQGAGAAATAFNLEAYKESERTAYLNYLRTRLLLTSRQANAIIAEFFSGDHGRVNSANAVQEGVNESNKGQQIWADAKRRFEGLRAYSERTLRGGQSAAAPARAAGAPEESLSANQKIDLFFASLDRNIKLTSTYPSMLIMAYHLARLNFVMRIFTWGGVVEIDGGQILSWFVRGDVGPWFAYGSDFQSIPAPEIPMVFHYALELGTLEQSKIELPHFFQLLAAQTIGPHRVAAEKVELAYRTRFDEAADMHEFRSRCREIESPTAKTSVQTQLKSLRWFTSFGFPQSLHHSRAVNFEPRASELLMEAGGFYSTERDITKVRLDENIETLRLDLGTILEKVQIFERMAQVHLRRAQRDEVARGIRSHIEPIERLQRSAYRRIAKLNEEIGGCIDRMVRHEMASQSFAVSAWIEHLKQAHAAMTSLRQRQVTDRQSDLNLLGRLQQTGEVMQGYAEHEQALGYDHEFYRSTSLQVILRMKLFLEHGANIGGQVRQGPRQARSILLPPRLRDLPNELREKEIRIPYVSDVNEFVDFGLRATIGGTMQGVVHWADQNSISLSYEHRVRALIALQKALASTEVPKTEGAGAATDFWRADVKAVQRAALEMQRWFEPDEVWTRVLRATGRGIRPDISMFLDEIAWRKGEDIPRGLLDHAFETMSSDKLGETDGEAALARQRGRSSPRAEFMAYRLARQSRGLPAIELPPEADAEIKNFYENRLSTQLKLTAEFLREAQRVDADRRQRPAQYPAWRMNVLRPSRDALSVPTLSPAVITEFQSQMGELTRETGYQLPQELSAALQGR